MDAIEPTADLQRPMIPGKPAPKPQSSSIPEPVPDLNWSPDRAREFGERVLDIWIELLERLPELPVSRPHTEEEVRAAVAIPVPDEPTSLDDLVAYLREVALERSMYPGHAGFMAYIVGSGTVPAAPAELLAAALDQNLGGWRLSPAATEIELHLMRWFAQSFGLPSGSGGLMTSGGAMAAFVALKAARDARSGWDSRERGVAAGPPLAIYASSEAHVVNERAADMMGLGRSAVRQIPVDKAFRMRVDALRDAIEADLAAGVRPIIVVATAGTVATGAIDPLEEIAAVCEAHDLWLHIDAAYGGIAALVPSLRPAFRGIERADSIAFDPHKWLYIPPAAGAVVVRDVRRLAEAFEVHPSYVHEDKARTGRGTDLMEYGPQFSRGFSALKVWVSLLAHGWRAYVRRIEHDVELARYLHRRALERPEFEPMAPDPPLSIACFRYVPPDLPDGAEREEYLDRLNERLMTEIQLDGRVFPSNAVLDGRFVLRACIVNFRTEAAEMDLLLDVAADIGARLDATMRPVGLAAART
ncbi:MAG TPA: aminotransferase class I/II-fold pyridoxal phosphate-dependent enzyme [Gemmatimonadota bacterium]|nr:aminotransferase class I/II-fold pyridoxal phosphate-dependent enzyme [Gemmatimonadota bacterium]